MDILIKKEVLQEYNIKTSELLLCADNGEIFQFDDAINIEPLHKIKWKIENETIIIYKEQEDNK